MYATGGDTWRTQTEKRGTRKKRNGTKETTCNAHNHFRGAMRCLP